MAFVAKSSFNPMSVAMNGCLTSTPSLFTPSKISFQPTKKSQLYCNPISTFSPKKEALFRACVMTEQGYEGNFSWDGAEDEEVDGAEGGYAPPPEGAKVYVGNLPFDVDHDSLAQLFQPAGVIEIAEVIYDKMTNRSRGFGFVTMSTVEEAERAVEMFNRYDLGGRLLTVNIAAPKGSRPERVPRGPGNRIYVGNISWNVESSQLEEMFREYGEVLSARIVSDRDTGRSRGFGFVEMSTESEMNDAIANLDGADLDGRVIRVNAAEEKPRRGRF